MPPANEVSDDTWSRCTTPQLGEGGEILQRDFIRRTFKTASVCESVLWSEGSDPVAPLWNEKMVKLLHTPQLLVLLQQDYTNSNSVQRIAEELIPALSFVSSSVVRDEWVESDVTAFLTSGEMEKVMLEHIAQRAVLLSKPFIAVWGEFTHAHYQMMATVLELLRRR